jgi:outer membrane protein
VKNLSLILNAVLLVAVAVLFYLHFSSCGKCVQTTEVKDSIVQKAPAELPEIRTAYGPIAYINFDSLTQQYEFYKQGVKEFESNYKRKEAEFTRKQQEYQESVERYQQLAPQMTDDARATREQQLMGQQQELLALRDKLASDLTQKEEQFNKDFLKGIDNYLKELSKKKNYSYVFTYSKGGPASIVFANDSLEITKEVIDGLNKAYKSKKSK